MESRSARRKRLALARARKRRVVIRVNRWQAFLAIFKGVVVWVAILTIVGNLTAWIN